MAILLTSDDEDDIVPPNFEVHSDEADSDDLGSAYDRLYSPPTNVQEAEADTRPVESTSESAYASPPRPQLNDHLAGNIDAMCCGKHTRNAENDMSDYGSESELDLSDAGIEGLRAFYGLSEATDGDLYDEKSEGGMTSDSLMLREDHDQTCDLNDAFSNSPRCTCQDTEGASSASMIAECATTASADQLSVRQPSPSDAAMVKATDSQASKPTPVHHLPRNDWREIIGGSIEENIRGSSNVETIDGYDTLLPPRDYPLVSRLLQATQGYPNITDSEKLEANDASIVGREPQVMVGSASGLVSHKGKTSRSATPPVPSNEKQTAALVKGWGPTLPPLLNFDVAKSNKTKVLSDSEILDAQSGRRKLRIDHIIDNSTTAEPENRKRKVDEISDVMESEVRAWASSTPLSQEDYTVETISSGSEAPIQPAPASTEQEPERGQQSKRLKKVMEGAAYIALGGVGLFSILVATAPDYL